MDMDQSEDSMCFTIFAANAMLSIWPGQNSFIRKTFADAMITAFPLLLTIGIVTITHNNLQHFYGHKGPPGGENVSPIAD